MRRIRHRSADRSAAGRPKLRPQPGSGSVNDVRLFAQAQRLPLCQTPDVKRAHRPRRCSLYRHALDHRSAHRRPVCRHPVCRCPVCCRSLHHRTLYHCCSLCDRSRWDIAAQSTTAWSAATLSRCSIHLSQTVRRRRRSRACRWRRSRACTSSTCAQHACPCEMCAPNNVRYRTLLSPGRAHDGYSRLVEGERAF